MQGEEAPLFSMPMPKCATCMHAQTDHWVENHLVVYCHNEGCFCGQEQPHRWQAATRTWWLTIPPWAVAVIGCSIFWALFILLLV